MNNNTKTESSSCLKKGDLVTAKNGFDKYHKGVGMVCDEKTLSGEQCLLILWIQTNKKVYWNNGEATLERINN